MLRTATPIALLLAVAAFTAARAGDDKSDALAKKAVEELVKALTKKDVDGLMKASDVPWTSAGKRVIKDRDTLKKFWQKALDDRDHSGDKIKVTKVTTLAKLEEDLGKKVPEEQRKTLLEVLGKDHRAVVVEVETGERKTTAYLGVRIKDGQAKVVATLSR